MDNVSTVSVILFETEESATHLGRATHPGRLWYQRLILVAPSTGDPSWSRLVLATHPGRVWYRRPILVASGIGDPSWSRLVSATHPGRVWYRRLILVASGIGDSSWSPLVAATHPGRATGVRRGCTEHGEKFEVDVLMLYRYFDQKR